MGLHVVLIVCLVMAVVGMGVIALGGPVPPRPISINPGPQANTTAGGLVLVGALIVVLLFMAGSGWAIALLPEDLVVRVAMAPVLGAGLVGLVALLWAAAGAGFGRLGALA